MSRLINATTMTVDGVTDVGEWYVSEGGHNSAARAQFDGAAGMVLGRTTYERSCSVLAAGDRPVGGPAQPDAEVRRLTDAQGSLEWNATPIDGDAADGISRPKEDLDGDLVLIGCGELARHLLANGLVDELRFWLHPAVWGEGARPYQGEKVPMRLLDSTSYDSGVTLLRYEPARL